MKGQEKCPACDTGVLVVRINKKSKEKYTFLGCSDFPECRYTERGGTNPTPLDEPYDDHDFFAELSYYDDPFGGGGDEFEGSHHSGADEGMDYYD